MKTFRLFAALMMAVVCVGLSSCSKDDDSKEEAKSSIVGTWISNNTISGGTYNYTVTFGSDGSGIWETLEQWTPDSGREQSYTNTEIFKYTINGNKLMMDWGENGDSDIEISTITISDSYMTLCDEGATSDDNCLGGYYKFIRK